MIYKYLGKEVQVTRFSGNDTAQLADGTWVPSAMLIEMQIDSRTQSEPSGETPIESATRKRAKASDSN